MIYPPIVMEETTDSTELAEAEAQPKRVSRNQEDAAAQVSTQRVRELGPPTLARGPSSHILNHQ